jgi:hypothetical protein
MSIHRITFVALLVAIIAVPLGVTAMQTNQPSMSNYLSLRSGYAVDGNLGGLPARSIVIYLERTANGWGGWMTLDANHQNFSEHGYVTETTLMAFERIDITLTMIGTDADTGRTCYAVNQDRLDHKLFLVFPHHYNGTYRLVIRGNGHATTNVVYMEEERADVMIANRDGTIARR